jgi:hypothetical protein
MSVNAVNRTVKGIFDVTKSKVTQAVIKAVASGEVKTLEQADIERLCKIIDATIDQSLSNGFPAINRSVQDSINSGSKKNTP